MVEQSDLGSLRRDIDERERRTIAFVAASDHVAGYDLRDVQNSAQVDTVGRRSRECARYNHACVCRWWRGRVLEGTIELSQRRVEERMQSARAGVVHHEIDRQLRCNALGSLLGIGEIAHDRDDRTCTAL